jgi:hypothetical protein
MNKEKKMAIIAQGLYGNRMMTSIDPEHFDALMLGYLDMGAYESMRNEEKIDRTIIRVPDTENLVLVYNRFREEKRLRSLQEFIQTVRINKFDRFNPSAVIPEKGIVLYSRCIACRITEEGELVSVEQGDYEKVCRYLTQ